MANEIKIEVSTLLDLKASKQKNPKKLLADLTKEGQRLAKELEKQLGSLDVRPELVIDFGINRKFKKLAIPIADAIVDGVRSKFKATSGSSTFTEKNTGKSNKLSLNKVNPDSTSLTRLVDKVDSALARSNKVLEGKGKLLTKSNEAGRGLNEATKALFKLKTLTDDIKKDKKLSIDKEVNKNFQSAIDKLVKSEKELNKRIAESRQSSVSKALTKARNEEIAFKSRATRAANSSKKAKGFSIKPVEKQDKLLQKRSEQKNKKNELAFLSLLDRDKKEEDKKLNKVFEKISKQLNKQPLIDLISKSLVPRVKVDETNTIKNKDNKVFEKISKQTLVQEPFMKLLSDSLQKNTKELAKVSADKTRSRTNKDPFSILNDSLKGCCKQITNKINSTNNILTRIRNSVSKLRVITKDDLSKAIKETNRADVKPSSTSNEDSNKVKELNNKENKNSENKSESKNKERQENLFKSLQKIGDIDKKNLAEVISARKSLVKLLNKVVDKTAESSSSDEINKLGKLAERTQQKINLTNKILGSSKKLDERQESLLAKVFSNKGSIANVRRQTDAELNLSQDTLKSLRDITKEKFSRSQGLDSDADKVLSRIAQANNAIDKERESRKNVRLLNSQAAKSKNLELGASSLNKQKKTIEAQLNLAELKGDDKQFKELSKVLVDVKDEIKKVRQLGERDTERLRIANGKLSAAGINSLNATSSKDVDRVERLSNNTKSVKDILSGSTNFGSSTSDKDKKSLRDIKELSVNFKISESDIKKIEKQLSRLDPESALKAATKENKTRDKVLDSEISKAFKEAVRLNNKLDLSSSQGLNLKDLSDSSSDQIPEFNKSLEASKRNASRLNTDTANLGLQREQVRLLSTQTAFLKKIEKESSDFRDRDKISKLIASNEATVKILNRKDSKRKGINPTEALIKKLQNEIKLEVNNNLKDSEAKKIDSFLRSRDNLRSTTKKRAEEPSDTALIGQEIRLRTQQNLFLKGIEKEVSNDEQLKLIRDLISDNQKQAKQLNSNLKSLDNSRTVKATGSSDTERQLSLVDNPRVEQLARRGEDLLGTQPDRTNFEALEDRRRELEDISNREREENFRQEIQNLRRRREQGEQLTQIELRAIRDRKRENLRIIREQTAARTAFDNNALVSGESRIDRFREIPESETAFRLAAGREIDQDLSKFSAEIRRTIEDLTTTQRDILAGDNANREAEALLIGQQVSALNDLQRSIVREGSTFRSGELNTANVNEAISSRGLLGSAAQQGQISQFLSQFARLAIGFSALGGVVDLVSQFGSQLVQLDKNLKGIQAAALTTSKAMERVRTSILDVATTTKFSVGEISEAAKILVQADVSIEDLPGTLRATSFFGAATESDLDIAADLVTSFRNVFKSFDDIEVANVLTKTINLAKLTSEELKTIVGIGAQVSKDVGLSAEQFLGAVVTLRNQGLKASTTATGLRQALLELFSPDKKTIELLVKRYEKLGEELSEQEVFERFTSFKLEDNGLIAVLTELKRLGISGGSKDDFTRVFDVRALNAILPAIDNLSDLAKREFQLPFGESALIGANIQLQSLEASVLNLGAALTALGDDAFRPFLEGLAAVARDATQVVDKLKDANRDTLINGQGGIGDVLTLSGVGAVAGFSSGGSLAARVAKGVVGGVTAGGFAANELGKEDQVGGLGLENLADIALGALSLAGIAKSFGLLDGIGDRLNRGVGRVGVFVDRLSRGAGVLSRIGAALAGLASFVPQIRLASLALGAVAGLAGLSLLTKDREVDQEARLLAIDAKEQDLVTNSQKFVESINQSLDIAGIGIVGVLSKVSEASEKFKFSVESLNVSGVPSGVLVNITKSVNEIIEAGGEATSQAYIDLKNELLSKTELTETQIGAEISKLLGQYELFNQGAIASIEEVRNAVKLADDTLKEAREPSQQVLLEAIEQLKINARDSIGSSKELFKAYLGLTELTSQNATEVADELVRLQIEIAKNKVEENLKKTTQEIAENNQERIKAAEASILAINAETSAIKTSNRVEELAEAMRKAGGSAEDFVASITNLISSSQAVIQNQRKAVSDAVASLDFDKIEVGLEGISLRKPQFDLGSVEQLNPESAKDIFNLGITQERAKLRKDTNLDIASPVFKLIDKALDKIPQALREGLLRGDRESLDTIKQETGVTITPTQAKVFSQALESKKIDERILNNAKGDGSGNVVALGSNEELIRLNKDSNAQDIKSFNALVSFNKSLATSGSAENKAVISLRKLAGASDRQESKEQIVKKARSDTRNDPQLSRILSDSLKASSDQNSEQNKQILKEGREARNRLRENKDRGSVRVDGRIITDAQIAAFKLPSDKDEAELLTEDLLAVGKAALQIARDELSVLEAQATRNLSNSSTNQLKAEDLSKNLTERKALEIKIVRIGRGLRGEDPDPLKTERDNELKERRGETTNRVEDNPEERRIAKEVSEKRALITAQVKSLRANIKSLKDEREALTAVVGATNENAKERTRLNRRIRASESDIADKEAGKANISKVPKQIESTKKTIAALREGLVNNTIPGAEGFIQEKIAEEQALLVELNKKQLAVQESQFNLELNNKKDQLKEDKATISFLSSEISKVSLGEVFNEALNKIVPDTSTAAASLAKLTELDNDIVAISKLNTDQVNKALDISGKRLKISQSILSINKDLVQGLRNQLNSTEKGQFALGLQDRVDDDLKRDIRAEEALAVIDGLDDTIRGNFVSQFDENRASGDSILEAIKNFDWSSLRDAIRTSISDAFFNVAQDALSKLINTGVQGLIGSLGFPTGAAQKASDEAAKVSRVTQQHLQSIESRTALKSAINSLTLAINNEAGRGSLEGSFIKDEDLASDSDVVREAILAGKEEKINKTPNILANVTGDGVSPKEKITGFFSGLEISGGRFKNALESLSTGDLPTFGKELVGGLTGLFESASSGIGSLLSGVLGGSGVGKAGGIGSLISGIFGGGFSIFRKGVSNFKGNKFQGGKTRFGRVRKNSRSSVDSIRGASFDGKNFGEVMLGGGESVITARATEFLGDNFIDSVNSGINPMAVRTQSAGIAQPNITMPAMPAPQVIVNNLLSDDKIEQAILTNGGRQAVSEIVNELKEDGGDD